MKRASWWVDHNFSFQCPCLSRPNLNIPESCDIRCGFEKKKKKHVVGGILCVPLSNAPASWDVKVIVVLLTPCFSQYFTGPLVAISLVKDCFFSLSGQSVTNNVLALQCLLKKPCETLRLGNVYEHSEPQETSRGKCSLSLSTPCFPFPSSTPYRQ